MIFHGYVVYWDGMWGGSLSQKQSQDKKMKIFTFHNQHSAQFDKHVDVYLVDV